MTAGGGAGGGLGRRLPLDWHPIDPIHIATTTVDGQFITRGGRLYGWAFEETTGAASAECSLIDGSSAGGPTIVPISLSAGESTRDLMGKPGLRVRAGVYLHVFSGSVRATIYYLGLSDDEIIAHAGIEL